VRNRMGRVAPGRTKSRARQEKELPPSREARGGRQGVTGLPDVALEAVGWEFRP